MFTLLKTVGNISKLWKPDSHASALFILLISNSPKRSVLFVLELWVRLLPP